MRWCEIGLQEIRCSLQELCLSCRTSSRADDTLENVRTASWDENVSLQQTADQCGSFKHARVRTVGRKVPEAASNCQARTDPSLPPEKSMPAVVARASTSPWCPGRSCCCPVCIFHTCTTHSACGSTIRPTRRQPGSSAPCCITLAEMVSDKRSHTKTL